jgi:hypothetical protein
VHHPPAVDSLLQRLPSAVVLFLAQQFLTDAEVLACGRSSWWMLRALKQYRIKELSFDAAVRLGGWQGPRATTSQHREEEQPGDERFGSIADLSLRDFASNQPTLESEHARRQQCRYAFGTPRHTSTVIVRFEDLMTEHYTADEFRARLSCLPRSLTRMHLSQDVLDVDPGGEPDPEFGFGGGSLTYGHLDVLTLEWPRHLTSIVFDDLTEYRHVNFVAAVPPLCEWTFPPQLTELVLPIREQTELFERLDRMEWPPSLTRLQFDVTAADAPEAARHLVLPAHIVDPPPMLPPEERAPANGSVSDEDEELIEMDEAGESEGSEHEHRSLGAEHTERTEEHTSDGAAGPAR